MHRQRGVTMIGWIFLLIPIVLVFYALLRIGPVYLDHYKLVQAMKSTAAELKSGETLTPQVVRRALGRSFNTGYVDVDPKEVEVVKNGEGGWTMTVDYERQVDYVSNLHLLLLFNDEVVIN
jgi:hypothetical protein